MITIIGGGIGGLTTALALEKQDIAYHVYERTPELREVGAGIWLAPNALQVMEWLGMLNTIQNLGNTIDRITIADQNFKPINDTLQDTIKAHFGYSTVAIHRATLQNALFNEIPSEKITLAKAFTSYEQLNNGKLKVNFDDNSHIETDGIIGADGINSKVRTQLFPNSKIRYSGQSCWRGIANFNLEDSIRHQGFELWGNQIRFGISQVSDDKTYWFAVFIADANQKDNTAVKQKITALFADFDPLINTIITHTPEENIIRSDISDLAPLKKWHTDNICLIGDAGHATTPNMGQGGAQAIEDAYYLSHCLAKEDTFSKAFASFQEKRDEKVNEIVKTSKMTGSIAHIKYGKGFRNFFLRSLPEKFMLKKMKKLYSITKLD